MLPGAQLRHGRSWLRLPGTPLRSHRLEDDTSTTSAARAGRATALHSSLGRGAAVAAAAVRVAVGAVVVAAILGRPLVVCLLLGVLVRGSHAREEALALGL
eukprot:12814188-Alexandrium_andersonii.AAC.1